MFCSVKERWSGNETEVFFFNKMLANKLWNYALCCEDHLDPTYIFVLQSFPWNLYFHWGKVAANIKKWFWYHVPKDSNEDFLEFLHICRVCECIGQEGIWRSQGTSWAWAKAEMCFIVFKFRVIEHMGNICNAKLLIVYGQPYQVKSEIHLDSIPCHAPFLFRTLIF